VEDDNVALIRRAYELWNEGDLDAMFALLAPDVVAIGHPEFPDPGPVRGREPVKSWMKSLIEAWDEVLVDVEQVIGAGDRVVVLFRVRGRGRGSGVEVTSGQDAHIWTLQDGMAVAFKWYQGTTDALKDAGITRVS
jgi:ketosteroid isomerase-like protein